MTRRVLWRMNVDSAVVFAIGMFASVVLIVSAGGRWGFASFGWFLLGAHMSGLVFAGRAEARR